MATPTRPSILVVTASLAGCTPPPPASIAEPPTITVSPAVPPASSPPPQVTAPIASAPPKEAPSPCAPGTRVDVARLKDAIAGHFSAPDAEERVGEWGCRPGEEVDGFALLRRKGDGWVVGRFTERTSYRVLRSSCRPLPLRSGRDLLVCKDMSMNTGVLGQWLVAIDYARAASDDTKTLLLVGDETALACDNVPAGAEVLAGSIDAFEVRDVDGDGARDLRVTVSAGLLRVPRCPASGAPKLGWPKAQTVDFVARGEVLVASGKSAGILVRIAGMQR